MAGHLMQSRASLPCENPVETYIYNYKSAVSTARTEQLTPSFMPVATVIRMSTPAPLFTAARLLLVGDTIRVSAPSGVCWATITALDDDEPNRRIRITARTDTTGETVTVDVAPGDKFDRQHDADPHETVIVEATDFWKWIGTHINHPNTGQRVRITDVRPAQHPKDGREIVTIVVANGPLIFSERTGHLVFEDN
jgi:hypothetical protein